jgi:hypothetical protein
MGNLEKRLRLGLLATASALALTLAVGTVPANAVPLPGKVKGLSIVFHKKDATFSWDATPGATKYAVVLEPLGVEGPFGPTVTTPSTTVKIAYTSFPRYRTNKKGWEFVVAAENRAGLGKSATAKSGVKITTKGSKVTSSHSSKLAAKINSASRPARAPLSSPRSAAASPRSLQSGSPSSAK